MASPTEAEVQDQWRNAIALIKKLWLSGRNESPNIIALLNALIQSIESDFASDIAVSGQNIRSSLAGIIGLSSTLQTLHIQSYLRHIYNYYNLTDINDMLDKLYDGFVANNQYIKSRQFTFGSPAAGGSNVGNGVILRLNKDVNNFDIENQHADGKQAKCVEDISAGTAKWEEVFLFEGQSAGIDNLDMIGSGLSKRMVSVSARDSLLLNPSFSSYSGDLAAPTDITDWTSSIPVNGTNYEFVEGAGNYYRNFEGDTTPLGLKIKASATLSQLLSLRGTVLDWKKPYLLQVAWKRDAGVGTLTINLGGQTVNVAVAAQSGWQILRIPIDANIWPKNFSQQDTAISIQWAKTSGNIIIDDVLLIPMEEFDGAFYAIVPDNATPVPFRKDDIFTWTDTELGAVIQYWLFRAFNRYLPHAVGASITFPDPALTFDDLDEPPPGTEQAMFFRGKAGGEVGDILTLQLRCKNIVTVPPDDWNGWQSYFQWDTSKMTLLEWPPTAWGDFGTGKTKLQVCTKSPPTFIGGEVITAGGPDSNPGESGVKLATFKFLLIAPGKTNLTFLHTSFDCEFYDTSSITYPADTLDAKIEIVPVI